ncbi:MAG: copper amine oxidase N-terminal domain-containing protein [Clostridiales bacterium]|nr:copper amine oxidase N-terminal domain-containing protein [Clostridiales bacterium]
MIKKFSIALIIVLIMVFGVFASASDSVSTADTDKYMLTISDIIEINELEAPDDQPLYVYTLPVGSTISITAKAEGVKSTISCYDSKNNKIKTFSMSSDGKASEKINQPIPIDTTVYYTVTSDDVENFFMSVDILDENETKSFFFIVEDQEDSVDLIVNAEPTDAKLLIDGKEIAFQAYKINDYNYFKLRDLAMAISGSDKQFEVEWDEAKKAIVLTTNTPYTVQGGELEIKDTGIQTGMANESIIYLDGQEVNMVAYEINNYNYFKLRDLGEALDFAVIWDAETNTIKIDTKQSYLSN